MAWLDSSSAQLRFSPVSRIRTLFGYLFCGSSFDSYQHEASVYRQILRKPIPYKILCKIAQLMTFRLIRRPNILQTTDPELNHVISYTLEQNKVNNVYGSSRRMQPYYHLAEVFSGKPLSDCSLLVVGPKFVVELILAWTYGFRWSKISAIDLIQTHRKISLANVDTYITASRFDVIVMANVFGYNSDPFGCLDSLCSCLLPGGLLIFNSSFIQSHDSIEGIPISSTLKAQDLRKVFTNRNLNILSERTSHKELSTSSVWVLQKC